MPNILTISRMLAAVALLFCQPFSVPFYCVYLYAGASDALDGLLARRLHADGGFGAKLDSVADTLFAFAALVTLIPAVPWERWMLLWVAAIACLRLVAFGIGLFKYRALPALHTRANKLAGVLTFLFPVLYRVAGLAPTVWLLGVAASAAAAEALYIVLTAEALDHDGRGRLFWKSDRK